MILISDFNKYLKTPNIKISFLKHILLLNIESTKAAMMFFSNSTPMSDPYSD